MTHICARASLAPSTDGCPPERWAAESHSGPDAAASAEPSPPTAERRRRHWPLWATLATLAAALLALPPLAGVPARLAEGCSKWIATAGVLELLSSLGFVLVFRLVFGARMSWRQGVPASLRALGASVLLPGGGLVGPGAGAWAFAAEKPSLSRLARSMVAFVILTDVPGVMVLGALGLMLWLGVPSGPRAAGLTLLPAALAVGLLTLIWLVPRRSSSSEHRGDEHRSAGWRRLKGPGAVLREGINEARSTLVARNWKLIGAVFYYGFDNGVLWAAFHAYGQAPGASVIVMGYLVGSLGSALPLPGGLGAAGGMVGALVVYGAPAPKAAAAVVLYRGIALFVPLVLGVIAWTCSPTARWPVSVRARRTREGHTRPGPRAQPASASVD